MVTAVMSGGATLLLAWGLFIEGPAMIFRRKRAVVPSE